LSLEIRSDLHTHTTYSHGTGSIEDNVKAAVAKGLSQIGITDHGPGHIGFGVPRKKLAGIKAEIMNLRKKYQEIEILFGVEANIIAPAGTLDIRQNEFEYFDFICAGWHYGAFDGMTPAGMGRTLGNLVSNTTGKPAKHQIRRNTSAIVNAVKAYDIMFLTHPGGSAPVDILEIALACADTNTLMEINTHHMSLSADDIKMLLEYTNVKFIVNSDAHTPKRVGDFEPAFYLIKETGLDMDRVFNLTET